MKSATTTMPTAARPTATATMKSAATAATTVATTARPTATA
jgi:hypothetical protein